MNKTYDEILSDMKNTFFEKTGKNVDLFGDIGARFQAVASELFSLSCFGDFVEKQLFVQTATGKFLDQHAQMYGYTRKTPSKAKGEVTFYVDAPATEKILIPKGTICCVESKPYIQFATDFDTYLPVGATGTTSTVTALEVGDEYNTDVNTITTMVNPPLYISRVDNLEKTNGGSNEENDDAFRKRIMECCSVPFNSVNTVSLQNNVLQVENVIDCCIYVNADNDLDVCVKTKGDSLPDSLIEKIENELMIASVAMVNTNVFLATPKLFRINIDCYSDVADKEELTKTIKKRAEDYCDSLKIGEDFNTNMVSSMLASIDGIDYCAVSSEDALNGIVYCNSNEFLLNSYIGVNYHG